MTASTPWTLPAGGMGNIGLPIWPHLARTQGCWPCSPHWSGRGSLRWTLGCGGMCLGGAATGKEGHGTLMPWEGLTREHISALMSWHCQGFVQKGRRGRDGTTCLQVKGNDWANCHLTHPDLIVNAADGGPPESVGAQAHWGPREGSCQALQAGAASGPSPYARQPICLMAPWPSPEDDVLQVERVLDDARGGHAHP